MTKKKGDKQGDKRRHEAQADTAVQSWETHVKDCKAEQRRAGRQMEGLQGRGGHRSSELGDTCQGLHKGGLQRGAAWQGVVGEAVVQYTATPSPLWGKLHPRRPQTVCAFQIETRACDVQSWETKDCVQSGRTHLKKELTSPNSKPFGEIFFKCEHDAGHAAQSAGS